jgi:hypothetical protein
MHPPVASEPEAGFQSNLIGGGVGEAEVVEIEEVEL